MTVPACRGLGLLHSAVTVNYALVNMRRPDRSPLCPQGIRRREHSLVALMDYRRRSGFDKANLAIAWAMARRPRPCVNSFSSSFW